jgi:FHA domain-containing protein
VVVDHTLELDGPGGPFRVEPGTYLLGREPPARLIIPVPDVSRRHARLTVTEEGVVVLADVGSANGTFRNGVLLTAPIVVRDGDRIGIAGATLRARLAPSVRAIADPDAVVEDALERIAEETLSPAGRTHVGRSIPFERRRRALGRVAPVDPGERLVALVDGLLWTAREGVALTTRALWFRAGGSPRRLTLESLPTCSVTAEGPLVRVGAAAVPVGLKRSASALVSYLDRVRRSDVRLDLARLGPTRSCPACGRLLDAGADCPHS